jgi:hypothetical protein
MQFIQKQLQAQQAFNLNGTLGGTQIRNYPYSRDLLLGGYWDFGAQFTNYILNNVCLSTSCN